MNANHIFLSNSTLGTGPRWTATNRQRWGVTILAAGLALVWWLHGSPAAKAGDFIPFCDGQPFGWPCSDTDFNECTRAACNGSGACDQNAILLIGQPCIDWDGDVCTVAFCTDDPHSDSAYCRQDYPNPDNPPCPDTDGDECSVPQCYIGVCDQSFYVPVGQECGEPDNDVCTFHYCAYDHDGNGVCASATLTCNDNNRCTFDHGCHPVLGCQYTQILCFDTDGNECTRSACDPSTGHCDNNAVRRLGEPCQDTDGSSCTVALCGDPCTGGDCGAQVACNQLADCTDLTPPEATCPPPAVEVFCLDSTAIGEAPTFVDDCDLDLALDNAVDVTPTDDPDDPVLEVIQQSSQATNDCGLSSECEQTITVFKPKFYLDIKPGSCPNLMDFRSRGTMRMSLVGTAEFDVTKVDVSSLVLTRVDENGSAIAPTLVVLQDTGTPFGGPLCGCHRLGGDGITDLTLKFSNLDVVTALQLNTVPPGATIRLIVTGRLLDGCEFAAADCMVRPAR